MTLGDALTTYIAAQLNDNPNDVLFDLGFLFERDANGQYFNLVENENTLELDKNYFVPCMLQFKADFNKPLNYTNSNQLAKSGTILLWFSLPDKDTLTSKIPFTYDDVKTVLEQFENKFTGLRTDGLPPTITVEGEKEEDNIVYQLIINSSPFVDNGAVVRFGGGQRVLLTLSLSVKLGHNIAYGSNVRTLIKKFGADDSTYVEIEFSNRVSGIASALQAAQESGEKFAKSGIVTTGITKQMPVYYPYGDAYKDVEGAKEMMLEFFRVVEDENYTNDLKYTVKTIYPDFEGLIHYKFVSSAPIVTKGVEISTLVTLSPFRING